ncbi:MAG: class I SAM-dependent methyltransferase [Caldilineaceae bacterium SB0668_bin_21]|nr:class I SAM-dependent methyltransferase [Caldilineaceae bacterium SB0668_bin_21]MYC22219.1 class I SAM-dependent methyltransferase [Caldilineaceae bacterium SB0662_bin_25]
MTNSENTPRSRSKDTSKTAVLVATIRAVHLRWHDPPHIFEDTFAMHMLTPFWHAVAKYRPLRWLVGDVILGVYRPVYPAVVLRSRYTEDQLVEAIESGTEQYVILGAGHDTFALRRKDLADKVRVFEVDHPATQEVKRQRILKANGSIPDNLTFVPVDFEVDRLDEEMEKAGFNSQQPAFYSWLGVTYYLTPEAIRDTLDRVAQKSAPGSRIVFDFKIAKHMMTQEGRTLCEKMEGFVARRGEPMLTDFTPQSLSDMMARHGYTEVEMMPPEEQKRRYLGDRTDLEPTEFFYFAQFATKHATEENPV